MDNTKTETEKSLEREQPSRTSMRTGPRLVLCTVGTALFIVQSHSQVQDEELLTEESDCRGPEIWES